jgi:hypothetical protein
MHYKKTEGKFALSSGILSCVEDTTIITIENGICTVTITSKTMAYDFVSCASWGNETTSVTSTIIPKMTPVPKSIYAIIEELFMARTDAGCEETPPTPAICDACPCKGLCDWLCSHEAV